MDINQSTPNKARDYARSRNYLKYFSTSYPKQIPWTPFVLVGILLAILAAFVLNYNSENYRALLVVVPLGLGVTVAILRTPELGGYLLIISVITNLSDILTDRGLPSINRPLILITICSILANYLLRTGKFNQFPKIIRSLWMLMVFFGAIVASTFVSSDKSESMTVLLDLTKDILVGITIFLTLNTKEKWQKGLWLFIITSSFLAFLGVIKVVTGTEQTFFDLARLSIFGQVDSAGHLRYGGPIAEPNLWGQILVANLPFLLFQLTKRTKSKVVPFFLVISTLLIILAIIYTGSRGAFLALVSLLPLLAIEVKANLRQILTGVLCLITLLAVLPSSYTSRIQSLDLLFGGSNSDKLSEDDSFAGRRVAMLTGLAMWRSNPFLGVGIGNYGLNYWQYAGTLDFTTGGYGTVSLTTGKEAHSLYVEILSETGIIGFMAFLTLFSSIFIDLYRVRQKVYTRAFDADWRRWNVSLIVSILIFLIGGFFLHGLLFRFVWVLVGMALGGISISNEMLAIYKSKKRRNLL